MTLILIALTFGSGATDVAAFSRLGGVFTSVMTGNIVFWGLAAAAALRPRPAVVVVLTDGYTPWPQRAPKGMRVVVGLLGEQAPAAPTWARAVRVEP